MSIFQKFVDKFSEESTEFSNDNIEFFESKMGIKFPVKYKEYLVEFGATHTPELMNVVSDCDSDLPDIKEFLSSSEFQQINEIYYAGSIPKTHFVFATDCLGNALCFESNSKSEEIFVYDTEFCEIESLDLSFEELVVEYLALVAV